MPGDDELSDLRDRLSAIAARWNIVEGRIKDVQNINMSVFIPAINELRYAGRKVVDAWVIFQDDSLDAVTERDTLNKILAVVEQYVENADHDVTDAICVFIHLKISDIIEQFGLDEVARHHDGIFELGAKMEEVNEIIIQSREQRQRRNDIYDKLDRNYIPYLKLKYNALRLSERTMEIQRIIRRRKERARLCLDLVCVGLAILGGAAALELFWPNWNNW